MIFKKGKVFVLLMTLLGGVSSPLYSMEKEDEEKGQLVSFLTPTTSQDTKDLMPPAFRETGVPQWYKISPVSVKARRALEKFFPDVSPDYIKKFEGPEVEKAYKNLNEIIVKVIQALNPQQGKVKGDVIDSVIKTKNLSLPFKVGFAYFVSQFHQMWEDKGTAVPLSEKDSFLSSIAKTPFADFQKAWTNASKLDKQNFETYQNICNVFFSLYQNQHPEQPLPGVGFLKDVKFSELTVGFVRNGMGFIAVSVRSSLSPWNKVLIPYGDNVFGKLGQRALLTDDAGNLVRESGIFFTQHINNSVEMIFFHGEKSRFPFVMGKSALIPSSLNLEMMDTLNNLDNLEGISFFSKTSSRGWMIRNLIQSCDFNEKKKSAFVALPTTEEEWAYLDAILLDDLTENLNLQAQDSAKVKALEWVLKKEEKKVSPQVLGSTIAILQDQIAEKLQTQTNKNLLTQTETLNAEEKKSEKKSHLRKRETIKKEKWKVKTKIKSLPVKEKAEKKEDPVLSGTDQETIEAIKKQAKDYLQANKATARARYKHLLTLIHAGIKETFSGHEDLLSEIERSTNTAGSHQNSHFGNEGMTLVRKHGKKDSTISASKANSLTARFLNKIMKTAEKRLKEKSLKESLKENKKSED